MAKVGWEVRTESDATPNHATRDAFAKYVHASPQNAADAWAITLSARTNILAAGTEVVDGVITSLATDAAIASQLSTDWSVMAGV